MAEKKSESRAQKAVSDVKKKTPNTGSASKSAPKKKKPSNKTAKVKTEYESLPANFVIAAVSLCLFVLLVVICVNPDGLLLRVSKAVVLGLVGQAGFYFAIPALLYVFVLHCFKRMRAVQMRSICALIAVFCCGMIYHLVVQMPGTAEGFGIVAELYHGGVSGTSGGVLCGGAAWLLQWACGNVFAYLIAGFGAVIAILGAMQITIPSIIRAIANRPRDEWEEDEEEYIEPAAVVVNRIANRQIQQKQLKREHAKAIQTQMEEVPAPLLPPAQKPAAIPTPGTDAGGDGETRQRHFFYGPD